MKCETAKYLQETKGMTLTIETTRGISYTGVCHHVDDNYNICLDNVKISGSATVIKKIFIRGSTI